MTTTATNPYPDVALPPGARALDQNWQGMRPMPYRVLCGELRGVDGLNINRVSVQTTAIQLLDGRIDDGSLYEAPHVYLGDDALTSGQARELATALIEAADAADRWAQR
jgi:hypothetical protein